MERLLTKQLVESLGRFGGDGAPVTSVYLGAERGGRHELASQLREMVGKTGAALQEGRSHAATASIEADVRRCTEFLENMRKINIRGLGMFSCSAKSTFEAVGVAVPFRPHLVVADSAAVAPLYAALDEFKRIAVCIVDRREAKLYEYFMGRMEEVKVFSDDVPGRVRVGGFSGYEESRISRHTVSQEVVHLKNAADVLFEQFKLRGFDWLFLAARPGLREHMERALHTYVRDRLKCYVDLTLSDGAQRIMELTRETAESLKKEETAARLEQLVGMARSGGAAVTGLAETLRALDVSAVRILFVRSDLSRKGAFCPDCGRLGIKRRECRHCGGKMKVAPNIIETAEEMAASSGSQIRHVTGRSRLDEFEGIGALLRFPLKKQSA